MPAAFSTAEEPLLLGLDVGSSRIKGVLVDRSGQARGMATGRTPFSSSPEGADMAVEAFRDALAGVLSGLGPDRGRVAGVGVAGMAESGTSFDVEGRPLGPVIAWHDPRGGEAVERLQEHFGDDLAVRIGQRLRTVSSVAKLGWMLEHAARPPHRWLGVPELCLFELSGAQATEHSLAARTGCYDVSRRAYLPEVAEFLGLSVDVFPPVRAAGEAMGRVSAAGAAWSGLPEGVPVTIAGHDHLAGAEGVAAGEDDLVNSVGTAETVLRRHREVPDLAQSLSLRVAVTVRPGGAEWVVLSSAARAGLILDAVARALGRAPHELDDLAELAGEPGAEVDVDALRASVDEGSEPELPPGSPGEIWNGLLKALADRTAEAADRLVELLGPSRRMVVFGGGSASGPWLRAKARSLRLPVLRSTAGEAVARGAAITAGVAVEWWPGPQEAPLAALEPLTPQR
ncbi:MAG: FGGY family carbohydrate kinase [Actinomycetota bacterium]|nr:FGGY family carbohydrate kinase [Actinomycetota bacterium]